MKNLRYKAIPSDFLEMMTIILLKTCRLKGIMLGSTAPTVRVYPRLSGHCNHQSPVWSMTLPGPCNHDVRSVTYDMQSRLTTWYGTQS